MEITLQPADFREDVEHRHGDDEEEQERYQAWEDVVDDDMLRRNKFRQKRAIATGGGRNDVWMFRTIGRARQNQGEDPALY